MSEPFCSGDTLNIKTFPSRKLNVGKERGLINLPISHILACCYLSWRLNGFGNRCPIGAHYLGNALSMPILQQCG